MFKNIMRHWGIHAALEDIGFPRGSVPIDNIRVMSMSMEETGLTADETVAVMVEEMDDLPFIVGRDRCLEIRLNLRYWKQSGRIREDVVDEFVAMCDKNRVLYGW